MIEIVYKENKEQANGNEGYFHLPKNIRQVGDTNGRERIYLEDYVGTFLKKYFSAPEGPPSILHHRRPGDPAPAPSHESRPRCG